MMSAVAVAPMRVGMASAPAYAGAPVVPRVEYAGFWLRFLAFIIDNVVMGVGFVLVLIPLIFLTGLHGFIGEIHPNEDLNDVGIFMLVGLIFLAATLSLVLTWLYHALMESSEWQATVGKKLLGMVVTDMAGARITFCRAAGRHFGRKITNNSPALQSSISESFSQ